MNKWTRYLLLMPVLLVQALSSCSLIDEPEYDDSVSVNASIAFMVSGIKNSSTRMANDLVQNNLRRQPSSLYVIAMQDDNPKRSTVTWEQPVIKEGAGENPASLLYRSGYCDMASGVDHCLIYGDVRNASSGDLPTKVYNGSLLRSPLYPVTTQSDLRNISYYLESIYSAEAPEQATSLATALTNVANLESWVGSNNSILKNLRQNFTNHGYNLPGSAASVKQWLESLVSAADSYLASGLSESENTILNSIKSKAGEQITAIGTISSTSYPRNLYLPDGAAALRWVESANEFQPEMQTTTLDNINSVSRFAYPAALYYFVDSTIKTSEDKVDFEDMYSTVNTTEEKLAWDQVLSNGTFDQTSVSVRTKSIALEKPVQYAVAQLHVTLKANGTTIKDDADDDIDIVTTNESVTTNNFQLTGVIVCGQRPVNYKFEQESNSDADVKFIYDSQVVENCYLSTVETNACQTLVLQSYSGEDVNIILELEYNGKKKFKCVDGYVYPGTRFYLAGKVDHSSPTSGNDGINNGRVFTKDYITTVNMVVTSLAKAYNVLPNLLTSNLEIGVQTNPDWIAVTPTVIRME